MTSAILDVRSAAEYEAAHIRGSSHVPLATLAEHTHVLDGGLPACTVAGSLVVLGLAAGRLVSAKARLLAAGIGAGSTFSALTDTCAMGTALARLPINRGTTEPGTADTLAALRTGRRSTER